MTKRIFPGYFLNVRPSVLVALAILLAFICAPSLRAQIGAPPAPQVQPAGDAGDYIVSFQEGTSASERAAVAQGAGASLRFNYTIVNAVAVHVPSAAVLTRLQNDPSVESVIVDRVVQADQAQGKGGTKGKPPKNDEPSDPASEEVPSGVERIGAPSVWENGTTGDGVGVAVVDTGIDFDHLDLNDLSDPNDPKPLGTESFVWHEFGDSCQDDNGHGTHVTGIIAARDNGIDVVGVAPNATVYCVKVLNASGSGSDATVMAGLDWVATHAAEVTPPIRVVNISLGRPGTLDDNTLYHSAVQALTNAGISVVVSAGNDPCKEVSQKVPATYPEVMAIASTTALDGGNKGCRFFSGTIWADTASYFTTDGNFEAVPIGIGVTVSAPGEKQENVNRACFVKTVGILSTKLGGGTTRISGTSMSAPHVA
ncbi:MAG: S8 family serine peptidase, partial [Acidobacteria bacterium]|nr:S8 family serine peptidase [Acidobacteriota bacterium]